MNCFFFKSQTDPFSDIHYSYFLISAEATDLFTFSKALKKSSKVIGTSISY